MSVRMWLEKKQILHTKTSDIDCIHRIIEDYICEKDINLSSSLDDLMVHLEPGSGGVGIDFSEYLKTKKDAQLFMHLLKIGIQGMENIFVSPYKEKRMKILWNFYDELVKYAQKLPE